MLCPEATHVQVQALFTRALEREGLLEQILALIDDPDGDGRSRRAPSRSCSRSLTTAPR